MDATAQASKTEEAARVAIAEQKEEEEKLMQMQLQQAQHPKLSTLDISSAAAGSVESILSQPTPTSESPHPLFSTSSLTIPALGLPPRVSSPQPSASPASSSNSKRGSIVDSTGLASPNTPVRCKCECMPSCVPFSAHKQCMVQLNDMQTHLTVVTNVKAAAESHVLKLKAEKRILKAELRRLIAVAGEEEP